MKVAVCVQYEGSGFSGWQCQKHEPNTVQAHIERAMTSVANHPVKLFCSGRTDAGVHAQYQICHFETSANRTEREWLLGCNSKLPQSIAIQWAKPVSDDFHARFSALSRSYRYVLHQNPFRPGTGNQQATWVRWQLDVPAMQQAADYLLGEHNFNAFKAAGCQSRHSVRTITQAKFIQRAPFLCFEIRANAFLQHMVRNIVGTLLEVGKGEQPAAWVKSVLDTRDRREAGVTAPPNGLYFVDTAYDEIYGLPGSAHFQGWLAWFDE